MSIRSTWRYLVILLALTTFGCPPPKSGTGSEALLLLVFNSEGSAVYRIGADGKDRQELFKSTADVRYVYASGNSANGPFVVVTRQTKNGVPEDQIKLCEAGVDRCQPITAEDGYKGFGLLSPDNRQVVFSVSPRQPYGRHRLWVSDLETRKTQQLTRDTPVDTQSWDSYPLWRPDGKEIAFIRATQDATARKIATSLRHIPSNGGEPQPLLSTDEPVAGYCYSPDGSRLAAFTSRGLDLIDLSSGDTKTLLAWASIPDRIFRASGMVWFPLRNAIVFALANDKAGEYELWSVPVDGSPAAVIYKQAAVQMVVSSRLSP